MQANRNINLLWEKAPVNRLSHSKAPKSHQICHYRHTTQTSELFLLLNKGVDFSLRNNFANSGSFAKVSVPVYIYNSLIGTRPYNGVVYFKYEIKQFIFLLFILWVRYWLIYAVQRMCLSGLVDICVCLS